MQVRGSHRGIWMVILVASKVLENIKTGVNPSVESELRLLIRRVRN